MEAKTLTAADLETLQNDLMPFIVRRVMAGESFESALHKAADDARDFLAENKEAVLDIVYERLTA